MRIWFFVVLLPLMLVTGATKSAADCAGEGCGNPSMMVQEPLFPGAYDGTIPANLPAHDNSCAFAFNSVCDEPTKCKVGTDINDCDPKSKP